MTRMFFFSEVIARASVLTTGAMITSTNCLSRIALAVLSFNIPLIAMTPPNADVGSVANALL